MSLNQDNVRDDCGIASEFIRAVAECFHFLVDEHMYEQRPPQIWGGGRETNVEYIGNGIRITICYELGSGPPQIIITNCFTKERYGLGWLLKKKYPERDSRIHQLWYTSRRSNPAIAEVVKEYADFFRKEGAEVLSTNFTAWADNEVGTEKRG